MLHSRCELFLSALPNSVRLAWRNLRVNTDPGSLIIILGLPAMYLVFMGNMFVSIIPPFIIGGYEYTYRSFLPGGILAFESVMAGTMGGSMLWADRRFGMFSQILSGPFTRTQYLFGVIMATIAASLVGSLVLIGLAIPLGISIHVSLVGFGLVLANLILGGIFFCSLMLFVAAKVDSNQAYNSIQILIIFVVSFISDAYYPIKNGLTPLPLQIISQINPLTYVTDGIRAGLAGPEYILGILQPWETAVLVVETIAMFLLAYRIYSNVKVSTS
jgi:ABC-2 type transport system permease protein